MATLTNIAKEVLNERYLLRNSKGEVIEGPDQMWYRVASTVATVEKTVELDQKWFSRFYQRMSNLDFLPNTPTLMNAGKKNGQLSACFVLPIEDSISGIFETLKHTALVHQTGGGTGFDFSRLRPEGSMVSNKSGVSTGPLAFCQVYDRATEVIKQGASRRGANMMTLRVDHPDILNFIQMKSTKGVMENFNVSVCITKDFMEALERDGNYELHHPFSGYAGSLSARMVWELIAECAWASAEPGIIFIDRINEESSFHDYIETVNPCGEQPLPPYGVCNLGSINLSNFVKGDDFAWHALEDCVIDCTRFLDNVIDTNCYPLPEIKAQALRYRNIGLGVMGWADALIKLGIPYDSEKAISIGATVQKFITNVAHQYSDDLAHEKGMPEGTPFKSPFSWASKHRRNATLTTVAPTGTISMIAGCSSGIEPVFAFEMKRNQMDRVFIDYHPLYKVHKESGNTYESKAFVEAGNVTPEWHVRMQAAFQKHVDSAISKTINLPRTATVKDVELAYRLAYDTGCKGVTVYVDGSRGEGVLSKVEKTEDDCCLSPNVINEGGCMTCKSCGVSKCSIA